MFKPTHRLETEDGSRSFAAVKLTKNTVRVHLCGHVGDGSLKRSCSIADALAMGEWWGPLRYMYGAAAIEHIPATARLVEVTP